MVGGSFFRLRRHLKPWNEAAA
jgi:hypothetical protein